LADFDDRSYRLGVGMMMVNRENKVFVGKRLDTSIEAWQMPQGGVNYGEDIDKAALRELYEEVGTKNVKMLAQSRDWYYYDLPQELAGKLWRGRYKGQKQRWFLMRFLGLDVDINIHTEHPEFCEWRWVDVETLPDIIIEFKRDMYLDIVKEFKNFLI
jgi:putative (di)nucleoside polyphosphate hydrolase